MAQIDYYFSTLSPWTYLAGDRLEVMAQRFGASVTYKPMDIMRVFAATGGKPLPERHPARQDYRLQELRRAQKRSELPLNTQPAHFPTNAAPSSYAIIAAQTAQTPGGDTGALVQSILRACWGEDRDIADDGVIRDCLKSSGFDPSLADSGLLSGAMAYEKNTEEAVQRGVFGSPFYIVDGAEKFWGQDRLADLEAHLAGEL